MRRGIHIGNGSGDVVTILDGHERPPHIKEKPSSRGSTPGKGFALNDTTCKLDPHPPEVYPGDGDFAVLT
jgi:hypothetical protein